jgi:hypothetical protein
MRIRHVRTVPASGSVDVEAMRQAICGSTCLVSAIFGGKIINNLKSNKFNK